MNKTNINSRNTGTGKAFAILNNGLKLSNRQKYLLNYLKNYGDTVIIKKNKVSMEDLASLTAFTNVEYTMFTRCGYRLICRGDAYSCDIDINKAKILSQKGYRWSGHTHVSYGENTLIPSDGDKKILKCFKQNNSVIYNANGRHHTFDKED